jgi:hypothetical protein
LIAAATADRSVLAMGDVLQVLLAEIDGLEIRLPFFPRDRTSPTRPAMSVSCHERTSGTLPNRSKTRSYGVRGHLAFWGEGVRLHGGECA